METMRVRLTFLDEALGTASSDPELHEKFIASKAPDAVSREEEIAAVGVDEVVAKGRTIFPKDENGNPVFFNYQIKGFFKSACSALRTVPGTISSKVKAYKKKIDLQVFVYYHIEDIGNRMIPITLNGEMGNCQRPLRAQTMQGERVALADSETIPAGSTIEFDIAYFVPTDRDLIEEWLDYGKFNGLGQWRNSGKGSYIWEMLG